MAFAFYKIITRLRKKENSNIKTLFSLCIYLLIYYKINNLYCLVNLLSYLTLYCLLYFWTNLLLKAVNFQQEPNKTQLKVYLLDLYHDKSLIECYNFCQQWKDHFNRIDIKGTNRILFTASFLWKPINFYWAQHK